MSSHRIQPSLAVRERRAWNTIRRMIAEATTRTRDDYVLMPPPAPDPADRQSLIDVALVAAQAYNIHADIDREVDRLLGTQEQTR
ncbi:hypothetical protein DUY81_08465 [Acidipropionibacterium acidipropionici]|uniref:Uncharacterized protein n=1 Tax=Acidipropionibacterium acidipropionici TaxID=1748 RepID=A0AAC8YDA5_9ACTN|nr:hypothetical protein [Acidipropionibacterium acidipropionici]AMS04656.1 hypothetical protein AXH35_03320 [Acidipropionibacterium acidipropionici]AOZ46145.1 hypothetical protein A8L58_04785 [Acidipropionibacterium acidipropionici]AZP37826.1 hypothetical protein DUY81_08465 [Acidipropionibacterium acidipropionici]